VFTDRARIHVEGGHGGAGAVSFRREARTPRGGPDGGNGGDGGSVILVADPGVEDLSRFRHAVHHRAARGAHGEGARRHGRAGPDLEVAVPVGTRVIRDDAVIASLDRPGDRAEVARGGTGGAGNWAFRSSTRQAPRESLPGTGGDAAWLTLELRLPVDVAIVGLPNSGKSALLRALTGAPSPVAAYPYTTTEPVLGPLEDEDGNLYLAADLPGVGADGEARQGSHLEQLERARVILHAVDASDQEPAATRIERVRAAVAPYRGPGARELVVATHGDLAEAPGLADAVVDAEGGTGVAELRDRVLAALRDGRA